MFNLAVRTSWKQSQQTVLLLILPPTKVISNSRPWICMFILLPSKRWRDYEKQQEITGFVWKGCRRRIEMRNITTAYTPVYLDCPLNAKPVPGVNTMYSGVLPKTLSEYSSEQMDSVEMLGENVCVCMCLHGKECKMSRLRCVYAEVFPCSTAQHRAVHSHPQRLCVCACDSACTECPQTALEQHRGTGGSRLTHLLLGPLHIFVQSSLSSPGHLKLPLRSHTRKFTMSIKKNTFFKSMEKYLIRWLCQLSHSWNADSQSKLLI